MRSYQEVLIPSLSLDPDLDKTSKMTILIRKERGLKCLRENEQVQEILKEVERMLALLDAN